MVFDVGDSGGVGVQCVGYVDLGRAAPLAVCCQGADGVGLAGKLLCGVSSGGG